MSVGTVMVFGSLAEPVAWGRRSRGPVVVSTVVVNLAIGAALISAGRRLARGN